MSPYVILLVSSDVIVIGSMALLLFLCLCSSFAFNSSSMASLLALSQAEERSCPCCCCCWEKAERWLLIWSWKKNEVYPHFVIFFKAGKYLLFHF